MNCRKCGEPVENDSAFCQKCGAAQKPICPKCGNMMNAGAAFCSSCGERSATRLTEADEQASAVLREGAVRSVCCPRCRKPNEPGASFCLSCGFPLDDRDQAMPDPKFGEDGFLHDHAGFGVRVCAFAIDGILVGIVNAAVFRLTGSDTLCLILDILYWTLAVSQYEGTIGKRVLGLRVLRVDGSRCGVLRAFARYLCYFISFIILFIGFLMVAFRKDKRALHDLICDTVVVRARVSSRQDAN